MANISSNSKASVGQQQHAPRWNSCTIAEIENQSTKVVSRQYGGPSCAMKSIYAVSRSRCSFTNYCLSPCKGANAVAVTGLIFPPCEQVQLSSATSDGCGSGTVVQSTENVIEDNETKKLNAYDFRQEPDRDLFGHPLRSYL